MTNEPRCCLPAQAGNWPASTRDESTRGGQTGNMYYVYILISLKYKKTYTGISINPERRLRQHNSGYHSYTKRYKPWKVVYKKMFPTRMEARKREKYLKSATGRKWMNNYLLKKKAQESKEEK